MEPLNFIAFCSGSNHQYICFYIIPGKYLCMTAYTDRCIDCTRQNKFAVPPTRVPMWDSMHF